jgi:formylglycine-generating enzyme required for sulfatase activity
MAATFWLLDSASGGSSAGVTELVVTNTTGDNVALFRVGNTFEDAQQITDFNGERISLANGDYFLRADQKGTILFFPISIRDYPQGTETDGSYSVTIRSLRNEFPPEAASASVLMPVPAGYFLIGDRLNPNEPHFVWTRSFFIAQFEVTNVEYRAFLDAKDGYESDSNWTESGRDWKKRSKGMTSAQTNVVDFDPVRFSGPDMPVTNITWYEAAAYARWLTARYGGGKWIFSLPTEGEWEKAARGPDGYDFSLSRTLSDAESPLYNWKKNPLAPETVIGIAASNQRFKPNRYGLFHMCGNVVEWTQSVHRPFSRERPYDENDDRNRDDISGVRVARGGSWYSASIALLTIAYRDTFQPELSHHDLGFRIVARRIPD